MFGTRSALKLRLSFQSVFVLFALLAAPAMNQALGQAYPTKPIRIVSPFAAGAISDITLRLVGARLGQRLGVQILIENNTGAGGISAARAVIAAAPDGYTLALLSNATALSVSLFKNLQFDPVRDFVPVGGISDFANILATNGKSSLQSMKDVIAMARVNPGTLNVGTTIIGSSNHLTAALLKSSTGLDFVIIPYRGPAELLLALQRNDVHVIVQSYGALKEAVDKKQIRALAVTTAKRYPSAPDIPTVQEAGIRDFEVVSWNGLFAPLKTSQEPVKVLNRELRVVLTEQDIAARLIDLGVEPRHSSPEELGARMRSEITRWARVITDAGIEKQ